MENDPFFLNPTGPNFQTTDLNSISLLSLNWEQPPLEHFESALSSIVSSPCSNPLPNSGQADSLVIRELIGRLGSICNSMEATSPPAASQYQSTNNSCYSTPLNSPPKVQPYGPLARVSSFGGGAHMGGHVALPGQLSRVSSSQALMANEIANNGSQQTEMSSGVAQQIGNGRKRKAVAKGKAKEIPLGSSATNNSKMTEEDSSAKRCKAMESNGGEKKSEEEEEKNGSSESNDSGVRDKKKEKGKNVNSNNDDAKPPEPPKDYIHVRARRGQATDSHSLAERVRREKISERMKLLQDLVPGCNKVTGKAVMLDEIINYVQSLQRQVEFLSMKLATVNPPLDFNMDSILPKDMNQQCGGSMQHQPVYPPPGFPFSHPSQGAPLVSGLTGLTSGIDLAIDPATLCRNLGVQPPPVPPPTLDGFADTSSQIGSFWEDDLQSVVQMGFGQSQEAAFSSQTLHGPMASSHMKIEL